MRILYLLTFFVPSACLASSSYFQPTTLTYVLITPTYEVEITENCEEGIVGCDDVTYVGRNKVTGKSITLKGKSIMHMCSGGADPCRHEGYEFKSGSIVYRVTHEGDLVVSSGSRVLVNEHGVRK